MHILIADDDGITRLMLHSSLTRLGHQVTEAENGVEALAAWEQHHHPLIISDWLMPDLDGLELCRRVRENNSADFAYIILLTSRSGTNDYLKAMDASADDFVSKPFDKDQLAARVRVAERFLSLHENLRTANAMLEERVASRTAELQKALAAKSEFLSRASHELRTPMNHILGFGQLLEMDALTPDQSESVREILRSGQHLLKLIDRVLEVAQVVSPNMSFLGTPAPGMLSAETADVL